MGSYSDSQLVLPRFPISYITLTLPISVSRVGETFGLPIPTYAFVFSAVSVLLLGIVSPILYFAIRHSLKHSMTRISSEATLRGSFGEKHDAESFHTPQDKRPSPVTKFDPYPWTPTPTTKVWVPPSPHHGIGEATSPSSASSYGVIDSREESSSAYRGSNALPKQVPASLQLGQMSLHGHMGSISSVTSSGTIVGPVKQLSPVLEGDSPSESMNPHPTIPPAAFVARRQSQASPNLTVPTESDKFANVPLSPTLRGHKRSDTETSAYTGPRAISPDLKALMQASQISAPPTGPPPPPRKTRRLPIPSVPVDVDESDQGSILSADPSTESFDSEDTRPMSIGDVTTRGSPRRPDSMRTFWAAYDGGSPMNPSMPPNVPSPPDATSSKHDTMRTFWAAYEDPSPTAPSMPMPPDVASLRQNAMLNSNVTSPDSLQFRRLDPSVSLKPSLSAVGGAPPRKLPSVPSTIDHHRSRSYTQMPTPPVAALHPSSTNLRTSNSATARFNSPQTRNAHTHTPSELSLSSEGSYRTPRPHPGYL
ncbi:hypothetical protein JB92DRAFT_2786829 [Gautieria morchelliformis]|nr:hypothetical protein JB92DRAFT_2786829 [Gautieria morchelliformis]